MRFTVTRPIYQSYSLSFSPYASPMPLRQSGGRTRNVPKRHVNRGEPRLATERDIPVITWLAPCSVPYAARHRPFAHATAESVRERDSNLSFLPFPCVYVSEVTIRGTRSPVSHCARQLSRNYEAVVLRELILASEDISRAHEGSG